MQEALAGTVIGGIESNLDYLRQLSVDPVFASGGMTTRALDAFAYAPRTLEVLTAGTQTTIQDYPGRLGFWNVGVPPSGPMDSLSFRLGNLLLGNGEGAPGLECTVSGPALCFHFETDIALTGADFAARLNGQPVPQWEVLRVSEGSVLELSECAGAGVRAYILFRGGLD